MHLASIYRTVMDERPAVVVLDPITNLVTVGPINEVNSMLLRLIDFLQSRGITVMLTALMKITDEQMDEGVSSLVDTWISVKNVESNGERNKFLYVMKARGMKHSNQVREFVIDSSGVHLMEIYLGPKGILVGSEREERTLEKLTGQELEDQRRREVKAKRRQANGFKKNKKAAAR
jgi:circadian clock protein KaiC